MNRLVLSIAAAIAVLAVAGCGSGSSDSGSDPASLAPPKSPLFVEATVRPEGALKTNIESLAKSIGGIDDLGGLIVSELEKSAASSGEEFDYEKEVEPWLGEKGGVSFEHYDGSDFSGYGVAIQTTDAAAAQDFVDAKAKSGDEPVKDASYEGVDFKVESGEGTAIGVVGDFLVIAEDEAAFKGVVDASNGESLADEDSFSSTISAAPAGSAANVFVDIGDLVEQSGGTIDAETQQFLDSAGIDPTNATALASLIPGSEQVEIDFSSNVTGKSPPSGDASDLLGELPGDSVGAVVSPDFGKRLGEAVDAIDAQGIEGQVPPHKFKSTLEEAGIDLERITSSIGDLGVFVEGNSSRSAAGAVVLETKGSSEATNTVSNLGLLLRSAGTPGVTAIGGKATGFSIRDDEIGPLPIVVAAEGERIAIAYGLPAATKALAAGSGDTLSDSPAYKEAVAALGSTPITGFVDGPAALHLASALVPPGEEGFQEAKPYLTKVDYLAIGAGSSGDLATAKLIAGIGK
ncbi:MAG TPA: DUF3352 domain-containing protein [Solirubrobacterales bacterium]